MSLTSLSNHEFSLDIRQAGDTFHVLAPHLAKSLGFREAFDLLRSLPDAEKGSELVRTPGGEQRVGYAPRAYQAQIELGRLAEKARWHHHPTTGEKVLDTPQVRVTAKGAEAARVRLAKDVAA